MTRQGWAGVESRESSESVRPRSVNFAKKNLAFRRLAPRGKEFRRTVIVQGHGSVTPAGRGHCEGRI